MDSLPLEILRHICLLIRDYSLRDLCSLRLVNRAYAQEVIPLLYEELPVVITIYSSDERANLRNRLSAITEKGLGRHYLKYARKLEVACVWETEHNHAVRQADDPWKRNAIARSMVYSYPRIATGSFLQQHLTSFYVPGLLDTVSQPERRDTEFELIISLVARLQYLVQVDYLIANFPLSLLRVIEEYHPQCRLNILTFQLPTLDIPGMGRLGKPYRVVLAPFPAEILKSSALHTVALEYTMEYVEEYENPQVALDETFQLLASAPNLKHLAVRLEPDPDNPGSKIDILRLKKEWKQYLNTVEERPGPVARLESVCFECQEDYREYPYEGVFVRLGRIFDLSQLKSLDIHVWWDPAALRGIATTLKGLTRLSITVERGDIFDPEPGAYDHEMVAAIQSFHPLRFLCLRSLRSFEGLPAIMSQHGATLEGLMIEPGVANFRWSRYRPEIFQQAAFRHPLLESAQISWLALSCPGLRELRLPIQRLGGSPEECESYKALGNFSRLDSLILDLHCDLGNNHFDQHDPDVEGMRRVFANAATDETLVSGIWKLVFSNQASRRLRNLRCVPFSSLWYEGADAVIVEMSRSFLARDPDFVTLEAREVLEVGSQAWRCRAGHADLSKIREDAKTAFEDLWPSQQGNSNRQRGSGWFTRWKSIPLAALNCSDA